jgi:hypothetical protein
MNSIVPNMASTLDLLKSIRSKFQKLPLKVRYSMPFLQEYKSVTYVATPKQFDTMEIIHITDTQQGHRACNMKRLTEYRDWVLKEKNRFMVFGGDMGDFGTKISVGSPWEQMFQPDQAVYQIADFWAPARHRILGYVGGNHERRTTLTYGDAGLALACALEIPYSCGKQYINIVYGDHNPFTIHLWHGKGAAQTAGAKMNLIDRTMRDEADAHLTLIGHLHDPMVKFMSRKRLQPNGDIKFIKTGGAMSSSFLDYWGTYAEVMNLQVSPLMMARTILEPNGHWELTLR